MKIQKHTLTETSTATISTDGTQRSFYFTINKKYLKYCTAQDFLSGADDSNSSLPKPTLKTA